MFLSWNPQIHPTGCNMSEDGLVGHPAGEMNGEGLVEKTNSPHGSHQMANQSMELGHYDRHMRGAATSVSY